MNDIHQRTLHPLFLDAHGRDTGQSIVTLVERKDQPGLLGVARRDGRFVCPLPEGYDGETSVAWHPDGYGLVAHPNLPALRCDFNTGKTALVDAQHIQAKPGRIKLVTR